jgi:hypothetical protein
LLPLAAAWFDRKRTSVGRNTTETCRKHATAGLEMGLTFLEDEERCDRPSMERRFSSAARRGPLNFEVRKSVRQATIGMSQVCS